MSAMEDMLAKMLSKVVPPELVALLTPENIEAFGNKISEYITNSRESLDSIKASNSEILERLERLENVNNATGSNKRRGNPGPVGSGSVAADGGGTVTG